MMDGVLFKQRFWPGLADGSITLTFRSWAKPQVKVGRPYRSPAGMLVVDAVDEVEVADITDADARRAGFVDRAELLAQLPDATAERVYRIELHPGGPDPRDELRDQADLSAADVDALAKRLDRLDRASTSGPWTRATLDLIADHPARRAGDLAAMVDRELQPFKLDVRKLKALGLTESLKIGYRLSPRGRALLDAFEAD
jgi:hypothetical protein